MDIKDSVVFCQNDFTSASFSLFRDMRQKGELVDFRVGYEGRCIVGHRLVLAASVPYFHAIFSQSEGDAYLEEISPDSLESIVNFAYDGKIEITSDNVQGLLVASKFLEITQIYHACWKFLQEGLQLNNAWMIRQIAESHGHTSTMDIADCYMRENFEAFGKAEVFTTLPFWYLRTLIRRDDLNVLNEESVCEAVIRWAKSSPGHKPFLFKVLCDVRFSQLSFKYRTKLAVNEEIVQTCLHCKELTKEATLFHSSFGKPKFPCLTARPRIGTKVLEAKYTHNIYGIFAFCLSKLELSLRFLNLQKNEWKTLSSYGRCQVLSIVTFEGTIYVFLDKTVVTLDVKTLKWCQLNTEYKSLFAPKSVLHKGKIYFFSASRNKNLSVQCFDPITNSFLKKEETNIPLRDPGVASWYRYIYLTGGILEGRICDTTLRYDPDTREWTELSPMLCKRWEHGCTTLNGVLYACGGYGDGLLKSAEIYNPHTGLWSYIQSMNAPRWELFLVPYNGKLYAYPRRPWYLNVSQGMEIYDPEFNEWEAGAQIPDTQKCEILLAGFESSSECSSQGQAPVESEYGASTQEADVNKDDDRPQFLPKKFKDWSPFKAQCDDNVTDSAPKKKRRNRRKAKHKTENADDAVGV